ncbi:MAG TPA: YdeI/OmpD-associated family protein, partial [Bacteroidales bacterium]|nr:YdeI/OmpD-associated family protein [Bacteroidales bacterium]
VKPTLKMPQELKVPPLLQKSLDASPALSAAFDKLTPGRQREYVGYIADGKQDATRTKRREKVIPWILNGCGLNDKYRSG